MNKSRDEHRGKDRSPTRDGGLQNISHVPQSQMSHGYTQPDGQEEIVTTELATSSHLRSQIPASIWKR
jgi:hypothetical protein